MKVMHLHIFPANPTVRLFVPLQDSSLRVRHKIDMGFLDFGEKTPNMVFHFVDGAMCVLSRTVFEDVTWPDKCSC